MKEKSEWLKDPEIIDYIKEARQQYEQNDLLYRTYAFSKNCPHW